MSKYGKFFPSKEELNRLYWEELRSTSNIARKYGVKDPQVNRWFVHHAIPRRGVEVRGVKRYFYKNNGGWILWDAQGRGHEHKLVAEREILGRKLRSHEVVHHKDGNSYNSHPLNLKVMLDREHNRFHRSGETDRPTWFYNFSVLAMLLANMSTCGRLKVGCVITDHGLERVYSVGYNGNAKKLDHGCDSEIPGQCGCVHAEVNALIKVGVVDKNKVMFTTTSPCLACCKLIINSGFSWVFYNEAYRDLAPLGLLHFYGIKTCPYPIKEIKSGSTLVFEAQSTRSLKLAFGQQTWHNSLRKAI